MADLSDRFEEQVRRHQADILRYLRRRISDAGDAADAYSDALSTAWRLRRRMPGDDAEVRPWLYAIARNAMLNTRRVASRRRAHVQLLADHLAALPEPPDDGAEVRSVIASLPPQDAELIRLTYWEGLASHEIAVVLGISASAVRSRLAKARQDLASRLDDSFVR